MNDRLCQPNKIRNIISVQKYAENRKIIVKKIEITIMNMLSELLSLLFHIYLLGETSGFSFAYEAVTDFDFEKRKSSMSRADNIIVGPYVGLFSRTFEIWTFSSDSAVICSVATAGRITWNRLIVFVLINLGAVLIIFPRVGSAKPTLFVLFFLSSVMTHAGQIEL
jgi:hypothetical protein